MLSILIPTHNYNVYPLAKALEVQLLDSKIEYEIICRDDNPIDSIVKNEQINTLKYSRFITSESCYGLSFNRNSLANEAQYNYLLFIDGDSAIIHDDYIKNYIVSLKKDISIIYGGRIHPEIVEEHQKLRWKYGRLREDLDVHSREKHPYKCLFFNNCIIKKSIFESIKFNDDIKQYGYEDTILAYQLSLKQYTIQHIDNPVMHNDVDDSRHYLEKTKKSIHNLNYIIKHQIIDPDFVSITTFFIKVKNLKINFIIVLFYVFFNKLLSLQLKSSQPSIFLFDLYRLSYLCYINLKK